MKKQILKGGLILIAVVAVVIIIAGRGKSLPEVQDEAMRAGRDLASFTIADEDYFHEMDGGVALTPDEVKGRNTWIVWSGGNDRFWDEISRRSVGSLDLLKTLSSYDPEKDPRLSAEERGRLKGVYKASRDNRWRYLGLVNEPCFEKATGPNEKRFGLWLDRRQPDCSPDPFENEEKYPGVAIGARGTNLPAGSFYGYASGIVGLRLFPNPDFDEAAAKKWDPVRYYTDPSYYDSKDLIKPYRVGMSCAFCHVGPNPVQPPADAENPGWENLSSNVGGQYFWVDRILSWQADETNFLFQLLHSSRPGALDTSLVSTDYINNPRTMNAVYHLGPRLDAAKKWGREKLSGGGLDNKQLNDYVSSGRLTEFFQKPETVWTPSVLKDGADSAGALGSLNRVYLNIGLFSEEWLLHFNPLVGGKRITPIEVKVARKNSVYWQATEAQTFDMLRFFLKSGNPHRLREAPGGAAYLTESPAMIDRGKAVFADNCARCHSSKLPDLPGGSDPGNCAGPNYLDCWKRYWNWTKTKEFKAKMREIVMADDFLKDNLLSTDMRVPVTLLQTNACSPLATNAIAGNIWDNFSSQSYKDLPSVGTITVHHPITGEERQYPMPAGGRGYTRPASLVSLWSTAPYLLNNSVGKFEPAPSVESRMRSFQDSIEQMLWPERRKRDAVLGDKVPGVIDRTTTTSYLRVPAGYLPDLLQELLDPVARYFPWLFTDRGIEIGPIPAGVPINLLANLELVPESDDREAQLIHGKRLLGVLFKAKRDLKAIPNGASDEDVRQVFANLVEPLLELNKCPDFVVNRGHYFGTSYFKDEPGLSDADKQALIAFLKFF
jgi:hypothetical protein